ncbi:hypothetical protein CV944_16955 [Geobacillus sp. WSUCF-018B]|nr:hypothetical protein CV944_16955 [Geobacillus sp. WSUCF-018B]
MFFIRSSITRVGTAYAKVNFSMSMYIESNRNHRKKWAQWMRRKRKIAEATFSVLMDSFPIASIRANSVEGFKTALDDIFPTYTFVILGQVEQ